MPAMRYSMVVGRCISFSLCSYSLDPPYPTDSRVFLKVDRGEFGGFEGSEVSRGGLLIRLAISAI